MARAGLLKQLLRADEGRERGFSINVARSIACEEDTKHSPTPATKLLRQSIRAPGIDLGREEG